MDFEEFPPLRSDPEALALARRLARTDFSGESGLRESLRARLVVSRRSPAFPARLVVSWALAALVMFVPLRQAFKREPRYPLGENGLPVLPGRLTLERSGRAEPVFEPHPPQEVFEVRRTSLEEIFEKPSF